MVVKPTTTKPTAVDKPTAIVEVDTDTDPPVDTEPPVPECLRVDGPSTVSMAKQKFSASYCTGKSGGVVTLYYRPTNGGAWQSKRMPYQLGAYRTTLVLDERFQIGLDYYVTGEGAQQGSARRPVTIPYRP